MIRVLQRTRWKLYTSLVIMIGLAVGFALTHPRTAEPIEVVWTCLGSGGGTFGIAVWLRRLRQERYRERYYPGDEGLRLSIGDQVYLRGAGVLVQTLIAISGFSAMLTPPSIRPEVQVNDLVTGWAVIGIGIVTTWAAWFADRSAQAQSNYYLSRRFRAPPLEMEVPMVPEVEVPAKPWWESKTVILNALGLVLALLGAFLDNYQPMGIVLPPGWAAWLAMIALLGNVVLRFGTTQPVANGRGKRVAVADPWRGGRP